MRKFIAFFTQSLNVNVVTHEIAGIIFCTEYNSVLPPLTGKPFDQFIIPDVRPDVRQRLYRVNLDLTGMSPTTLKERKDLSWCVHFSPEWDKMPILRSSEVCDSLEVFRNRPDHVEIRVDDHYVLIRNFLLNQIDIFYCERLGENMPEARSNMPESVVENNFRQIFATFLPCFTATLLHSSGVIRGDKAALFLAPGGGGKTTVIERSNGERVLSDDQIILRREYDTIIAHSTPLGGITSGPCQAGVGGIFLLDRASRFKLEPISPSDLVRYLWTEHFRYTFSLTKTLKKRVFELFCDTCYTVPTYRMKFSRDFVDWAVIDAAMEKKFANQG